MTDSAYEIARPTSPVEEVVRHRDHFEGLVVENVTGTRHNSDLKAGFHIIVNDRLACVAGA